MRVTRCAGAARAWFAALFMAFAALPGAQAADDKTYVMKIIVGDDRTTRRTNTPRTTPPQSRRIPAAASRSKSIRRANWVRSSSRPKACNSARFSAQIVPPEFLAGIDERFEVLTAPGLVTSMARTGNALRPIRRYASLMLGLGADKGLHGVGLFMATPVVDHFQKTDPSPCRFQGQEDQDFRLAVPKRGDAAAWRHAEADDLGARCCRHFRTTPSMAPYPPAPYLQRHALPGRRPNTSTEIGQPAIFGIVEISKKWYNSLPADLQQVIDKDATAESAAINPQAARNQRTRRAKPGSSSGGELISLPPERAVVDAQNPRQCRRRGVRRRSRTLNAAYKIVTDAAQRPR